MMAAFARLQALAEKAGFNPDQPRAPGGGPGGGQWIYVDGYAQDRQPGIGDNGGPPLDPEEPPKEPPRKETSPNKAGKALAKRVAQQLLRYAGPIGALITAAEFAENYSQMPSVTSYQDAPKTLAELQQNAGKQRPGYEDHHIVEQGAGGREGFSRSQIDGADNVVSVPKYKHHEITGWFNTRNPQYGGLAPREYLRGKSWLEHAEVGRYALRKFGVLK